MWGIGRVGVDGETGAGFAHLGRFEHDRDVTGVAGVKRLLRTAVARGLERLVISVHLHTFDRQITVADVLHGQAFFCPFADRHCVEFEVLGAQPKVRVAALELDAVYRQSGVRLSGVEALEPNFR